MAACEHCDQQAGRRHVCAACRRRYRDAIKHIADLLPDLDDVIARRVRYSGARLGSTETPVVFDPAAAQLRERVTRELAACARAVPIGSVAVLPSGPAGAAAAAFRVWQQVGTRPGQGKHVARVERLARDVAAAVDRPPPLVYLGACLDCEAAIRARPPIPDSIRCRVCGAVWDRGEQEALRAQQREQALDRLVNVRGLADAATVLIGTEISFERVRSIVRRSRIVEREPGRWRVGDLIEYLERDPV